MYSTMSVEYWFGDHTGGLSIRQAGEVAELADALRDRALDAGQSAYGCLDRALCDMGLKDEFLMTEEGAE